jgi:MFS family permease
MRAYLALLQKRPGFRDLWLAQLVSLGGDWFNAIATVMLVNRFAGSGLAVSALFLARYLPPFFAGPIGGVLADRFDRKTILIASDIGRAIVVLGFLLVNSPDRVWLIYVLSVAQFVVSAFFEPARSAIVPELVERDELVTTNTLAGVTFSAMFVTGSAIGGLVAAVFGPQVAIVIDAVSYLVSAWLIARIAASARPRPAPGHASGFRDLLDGLRFTRRQPGIAPVAVVKGFGQLGNVDVIAAVLAARVFSIGQDGGASLGFLFAAMGVGTILGPPIANLFHNNTSPGLRRTIVIGYAAIAASWFLIGVSPWFALTLAAFTLRGLGGGINWIMSDILIQMQVPNHFLGRVFSLNLAFFTLVVSFSTLASGYLIDRVGMGPGEYSLWVGAVSLLPLVGWLVHLRRPTPQPEMVAGEANQL